MDAYSLVVRNIAARELDSIDAVADRRRISHAIARLASVPRPLGCQKLRGAEEFFRIRIGRYRVVYRVDVAARVATVVAIGDRKDVYR